MLQQKPAFVEMQGSLKILVTLKRFCSLCTMHKTYKKIHVIKIRTRGNINQDFFCNGAKSWGTSTRRTFIANAYHCCQDDNSRRFYLQCFCLFVCFYISWAEDCFSFHLPPPNVGFYLFQDYAWCFPPAIWMIFNQG